MEPLQGRMICPRCGFQGELMAIPHQLRPGTVLNGRYLVGGSLGQGGFGITYVGRDLKLDMRVAIKEYYPNGYANRNNQVSNSITITDANNFSVIRDGVQRFLSEARTLARFDTEPGVVTVHDFFETNQTAYIIMEFLDGWDLSRVLKEHLFPADEIFRLMEPVMNTLEKIHTANIIHRDISPDNLMLLPDGRLKLMDFGAARMVDYSDPRSLSVVLKTGYAPEEQYRSRGIQGPWTDIYALCATIYKCITGITPDDSLERGRLDHTRWPSELNIPISRNQEAVLKKGMAFRQEDRFQNIAELRQALNAPDTGQWQEPQAESADRPPFRRDGTEGSGETITLNQYAPDWSSILKSGPAPQGKNSRGSKSSSAQGKGSSKQNPPEKQQTSKLVPAAGIAIALIFIVAALLYVTHLGSRESPGDGTNSSSDDLTSSVSTPVFPSAGDGSSSDNAALSSGSDSDLSGTEPEYDKPVLGLRISNMTEDYMEYGISSGCVVLEVVEGSCSEKAGIQVDDIIAAIDGTPVDYDSLVGFLTSNYKAGDTITLTIYRQYQEMNIPVTLDGNSGSESDVSETEPEYDKPALGLRISNMTEDYTEYGISSGCVVLEVIEGSCSEKAGIQIDDIITAIDGTPVDYDSLVGGFLTSNYKAGDIITLTIYRQYQWMEITVTLDGSTS